jgi:mRNA interferase RelE/StbE
MIIYWPKALKEWEALDKSVKNQFKKKLIERLENPHNPKDKLNGFDNIYKTLLIT